MKKHFYLLAFVVFCFLNLANAQVFKRKTIHAGESLSDPSYYLFPSFADGTVKFKNGGSLNAKLNFNLLLCDMQFINSTNDTLVVTNPANIDSIWLNDNVFFFNKNYYDVVANAGTVKLVVLRKISYQPVKIGALGVPDYSATGVQTYTSYINHTGERKLSLNEDVVATSATTCYLATNNGELNKVSKATFIAAFPGDEEKIQSYLKQNKIDFNKEADLENLFQFCAGK